jgi:hypothetical protein
MEITKEQVLELKKLGNWGTSDKLKEWFPEAFKVELEVGKVFKYKTTKCIVKITELHKEDFAGYGVNYLGEFVCKEKNWTNGFDGWKEATTEEWESALIAEAKRRGYKNGNYECLHCAEYTYEATDNLFFENNEVWLGNKSYCNMIFNNGVWAEIIKTISKEEAEKQLGCKIT